MHYPQKKVVKTAVIKFFSESALKSILEQPDVRKKKGLRNLFFMILMYDAGVRNQELLDFRLSDIHFEGKSPYVVIAGKGGKHAQISSTLIYANADTNKFCEGRGLPPHIQYIIEK